MFTVIGSFATPILPAQRALFTFTDRKARWIEAEVRALAGCLISRLSCGTPARSWSILRECLGQVVKPILSADLLAAFFPAHLARMSQSGYRIPRLNTPR